MDGNPHFITRYSLFDTCPEHIRTELVEVVEGFDIPRNVILCDSEGSGLRIESTSKCIIANVARKSHFEHFILIVSVP